ncbi:MAG: hypothetical protein ABI999_11820 [Acidobacteriota bacterium]
MSIRDSIRDELYGDGPEAELKSERQAAAYENLLDDDEDPWAATKELLIYAIVEAGILGLIFFAPHWVAGFAYEVRAMPYIIVMIFALGFLISFRSIKLLRTRVFKKDPTEEDGIAAAYTRDIDRENRFNNWLLGAAGGLVNLIGFFLLLALFA